MLRTHLACRPVRCFSGLALLFAFLLITTGCNRGPRLYPVHVKVKLDDEPAKNIQLTFIPEVEGMPVASAVVLENGEAEVFSGVEGRKGALAGKYKVIFGAAVAGGGMGGGGGPGGGGGAGGAGKDRPAGKDAASDTASDTEASGDATAATAGETTGEEARYQGARPTGGRRPDEGGAVPNVPPAPFPNEYTQAETTPIEVVVEEKTNKFEFSLPKK